MTRRGDDENLTSPPCRRRLKAPSLAVKAPWLMAFSLGLGARPDVTPTWRTCNIRTQSSLLITGEKQAAEGPREHVIPPLCVDKYMVIHRIFISCDSGRWWARIRPADSKRRRGAHRRRLLMDKFWRVRLFYKIRVTGGNRFLTQARARTRAIEKTFIKLGKARFVLFEHTPAGPRGNLRFATMRGSKQTHPVKQGAS